MIGRSSDLWKHCTTLHWLPIEYCVNFKIANITFHTEPACLYSALHAHHSTCSLGLSNTSCSLFRFFVLHSEPAASAFQLLKSGTLSLQLFECVLQSQHFSSSSQDSLFPAGLPIHLTPSFLRLRFGSCRPLCAFVNYTVYLLIYIPSRTNGGRELKGTG